MSHISVPAVTLQCQDEQLSESKRSRNALNSRLVLVLYRKREFAIGVREHGGIVRFRYSDLKEAARFAVDAVVMQIQMREE